MSKKALHENNKDNDIINEKIYDSKSNISNNIKVSPIKEMNIKSIGSKIKGNPKMVEGTVYSMLIICSISHFLNEIYK